MWGRKEPKLDSVDQFKQSIDGAIDAALKAGRTWITCRRVESRIADLQQRAALAWHPNIRPKYVDGYGRPIQRSSF
jgi:hypothetical protein